PVAKVLPVELFFEPAIDAHLWIGINSHCGRYFPIYDSVGGWRGLVFRPVPGLLWLTVFPWLTPMG
ncbi:MAG TPA: hypothetical protein VGF03_18755, partial [Bryobacteraceae bacterium]